MVYFSSILQLAALTRSSIPNSSRCMWGRGKSKGEKKARSLPHGRDSGRGNLVFEWRPHQAHNYPDIDGLSLYSFLFFWHIKRKSAWKIMQSDATRKHQSDTGTKVSGKDFLDFWKVRNMQIFMILGHFCELHIFWVWKMQIVNKPGKNVPHSTIFRHFLIALIIFWAFLVIF